jgi:hypothetical protein
MRNVPKIVQARLQRLGPQVAKGHPDADLLTAFAEQSLAESERERVMEHLARCGACREVVALAQPVTELGTTASSVRAAGGAWLSWTVLRWAVVAAGVVLVTSVGILQYRQRSQQNASVVSTRMGQEEKVAIALQSSQPSVEEPVVRGNIPQALENAKPTPTRKLSGAQSALTANHLAPSPNPILPPSTVMNQTGSGGGTGGGVFRGVGSGLGQANKNEKVQAKSDSLELAPTARGAAFATTPENSTARSAPSAPVPQVAVSGAPQTVELQSESEAVAAQNQGQGQVAQNYAEQPSQNRGLNNLDVVKAKDSVPGESQASAVAAPNVSTSNMARLKALRLSPRWSISSNGVLQRSFDAGKTWEGVNIGERMESAVELRDQGREKKLQKKERGPAFVFLAVAALGTEVWAGGSRAMLYHSPDSGAHWTRVLPAEANNALTGDVIKLEFPDPQHGRVATSSGEVWLTSDDGQTWHKQQ